MNSLNKQTWHHDVITNCGLRSVARVQTYCKYSVVRCNYVTEDSLYLCSYCKLVFWGTSRKCFPFKCIHTTYSRAALFRTDRHEEPFRYDENLGSWIFLWKFSTLAICISAVTIYRMYLRLNLSTTPGFTFYKP